MSKLRMPSAHTKVYKDECVYSFDSPFSETGLYLNLVTLHGVGTRYLQQDAQRTGCKLYLFEKWRKIPTFKAGSGESKSEAPIKLAVGIEGGFDAAPKSELEKNHALAIISNDVQFIALPCHDLPDFLSSILQSCIEHDGMRENMQANTWDTDEVKIISKYADHLKQTNSSNRRIPKDPKQWKDEASDATENLWLNLSTGHIGGGRQNWDGTGGSGSALQHFIDTGKQFPLVVKLGTITPHGADVWSYADDENCMVTNPKLSDHLSFWGIDAMKLEKTEKTVTELEVALNMTYDWTRIMEGQEKLELLSGPGFVGFRNIGSSCYLNSAMQCLLSIPEIQQRYFAGHDQLVSSIRGDPTEDLPLQLSKLAVAALSDIYVPPHDDYMLINATGDSIDPSIPEQCIIAPRMFKHLLGRGHADFASGRQQDVTEFLTYFLEQLSRSERTNLSRLTSVPSAPSTSSLFEYHVDTKFKALDSNHVKLSKRGPQTLNMMWELPIPLECAVKVEAKEDQDNKRPRVEGGSAEPEAELRIPFEACVEAWLRNDLVTMRHPELGHDTTFLKSTRFATFPRYLIVKLGRYYVGDNWVQRKITAEVTMPEYLDINSLRETGIAEGERLLDDTVAASTSAVTVASPGAAAVVVADESLVGQLVSMGFSENGSRRAALATHNADTETAMNWVLEHMEDPDFNEPPPVSSSATSSIAAHAHPAIDVESVMMLSSMGYTEDQCTVALISCEQDIERSSFN